MLNIMRSQLGSPGEHAVVSWTDMPFEQLKEG